MDSLLHRQLDKFVELDEESWKMSIIFDVKLISSKLGLYWSVLIVKPWDGLFVLQGRPESPLPASPALMPMILFHSGMLEKVAAVWIVNKTVSHY